MRKQFTHFVAVMLLFVIAESARSQNKQLNSMRPEITKVSLPEALSRQIARDDNAKVKSCQLCGGGGDDDAKWLVENVTTLSVDLSGDGKPEWIVGYCGNHACSGWIYRRVGERYEMIYASNIDEPVALSTSSNGYRDLSGGFGTYGEIYKFDGKHYKATECRKYDVTYNRNGEVVRRKLIHRGPCPK